MKSHCNVDNDEIIHVTFACICGLRSVSFYCSRFGFHRQKFLTETALHCAKKHALSCTL